MRIFCSWAHYIQFRWPLDNISETLTTRGYSILTVEIKFWVLQSRSWTTCISLSCSGDFISSIKLFAPLLPTANNVWSSYICDCIHASSFTRDNTNYANLLLLSIGYNLFELRHVIFILYIRKFYIKISVLIDLFLFFFYFITSFILFSL